MKCAIGPMRRWAVRAMSPAVPTTDTAPGQATHRPEVRNDMPQAYIVIFLLFFAVLAFAWFYLQRAKARTTTDSVSTTAAAAPAAPAASAAAEHADHADHGDHSEHGDHSH